MTNENYNEFVDLLKKLNKNFRGDVNIDMIQLYFNRLKKYKMLAIRRGLNYITSNRKSHFFPVIGEIVEAIEDSKYIG